MSIFSHIRKSRQQAKEHSAMVAERRKKEEEEKVPYKHVPTHAATDAIASAPPGWREADRPRILEHNRRRSAMAASGHHMNMPGAPRVGSSLSHVSYPGDGADPVARFPRTYSYSGISSPSRRSQEVVYSVHDGYYLQPASWKGKEICRGVDSPQRISPCPSKGEPSPVDSSTGSSSSQDDLEIKPTHPAVPPTESVHRLHPSHRRRISDGASDKPASARPPPPACYGRDSRPPPSMRGFASINRVAATPTMHIGALPPTTSIPSPTSWKQPSMDGPCQSSMNPKNTRACSATTLPGLASVAVATPDVGWSVGAPSEPGATRSRNSSVSRRDPVKRRATDEPAEKTTRFSAPERTMPTGVEPRCRDGPTPPSAPGEGILNAFPEPAAVDGSFLSSSSKSKKLSKREGKLVKRSRWLSSKASAVAV
ncbi:hypothetical protein RJ55_06555 [Drechmeria coniospora]|nr:hypothetical protein RJ55_06555 [Drechmeria coniospora]